MNGKTLFTVGLVLAVCCQYGHAQIPVSSAGYATAGPGYATAGPGYAGASPGYASSSPGYASAGFADPSVQALPQLQPEGVQAASHKASLDFAFGDSCTTGCGGGCSTLGGCGCAPSWQFFGDMLYLRTRNNDVHYAEPIAGYSTPQTLPNPRQGLVAYDYEPGYRTGFTCALNDGASLGVSYTQFEGHARDAVITGYPHYLQSPVAYTPTYGYLAVAATGTDFDLVDLDFRGMMLCSERHTLNYLLGVRYAYLEQGFFSRFGVAGSNVVSSDVRFDGAGVRLGLEGERYLADGSGLMFYGRGIASFVAGEFEARYRHDSITQPVGASNCNFGRIVPILDLELGVGWTLLDGHLRFSAGYMFSAWYNAVGIDDFIQGVNASNYNDVGGMITFDGLVGRAEYRF